MPRRQARSGFLVACAVGSVAIVAAACQPVTAPTPPPTTTTTTAAPTSASCDNTTEAVPTPQHPVAYAAVVQRPGWRAPQGTSFTATSEADKNAHLAQLESTGTVVAAGPNNVVHAQDATISNPSGNYLDYLQQYGLQTSVSPTFGADFQAAWDDGFTGTNETIAIVDTGVDLNHTGLTGSRLTPGPDYVTDSTGKTLISTTLPGNGDPFGHGTHVAGIAAANDPPSGGLGGAPTANILAIRVLDDSGTGTDLNVAAGITDAVDQHADVISLSLGGAGCDQMLQDAVKYAQTQKVVVVAAAGNDGDNELFAPAAYTTEGVIAVAATDQTGNKASFSNDGSFVSVAAPGTNVLSTCAWTNTPPTLRDACVPSDSASPLTKIQSDSSYGDLSGTSMATPFVSAAAALVLEECPLYTPGQVKMALQNGSAGAVPGFGFNRLDAGAAVTAAKGCPASPS